MSEIHILNVGRADCNVLLLDTAAGRKTVVIDGGELACQGRQPLLEFLTARRISQIDLLILTHLHQDHFGGFHQLIDRVGVRAVVAPCGDLVFCRDVYPIFGDREFYREYHSIFAYFSRCGANLYRSSDAWASRFVFGDAVLRRLYPPDDISLPSAEQAERLCVPELSAGEIAQRLERHKCSCNADSSIWLLERQGVPLALFAGDSTDETMRQALADEQDIHPVIHKLSHHGIGRQYFSEDTQKALCPQILVVSVDRGHYNEDMQTTIADLARAGRSAVHYTFDGDFVYRF